MEQQLKERLVGATVLVVIAIIVIPMVLDGPNDGSVWQPLDLPSGERSERRTVSISLDDDSPQAESQQSDADRPSRPAESPARDDTMSEPRVAADISPPGEDGRETPDSTAEAPPSSSQSRTEPQPEPDAAQAGGTGSGRETWRSLPWTVQVGSFGKQANADRLVARLAEMGYDDAYVSRYDDGDTVHYRVRVGGYADRDTAVAKAAEISSRSDLPARQAQTTPDGG